jgi:transcriptional regulator with XRE-family HTH domain
MREEIESIGRRVRTLRQQKGWTLEEFSARCGLSVGFLSQVERGLSSISISSLNAICKALGIPLTHFFATVNDGPLVLRAGHPRSRIRIEDSNVTYNLLSGGMPDRMLEAMIAEYPPHYSPPLISHEGEEFGYVLEGQVLLQVEDKKELLNVGDSFHFFSSRPHTVQNPGDDTAKVLWVLTLKLLEGGRL